MKIENEKLFGFSVFTLTEPFQFPIQNLNFNRRLTFLDKRKFKRAIGFSVFLHLRFGFAFSLFYFYFFFFFFCPHMLILVDKNYCLCTVVVLFMYYNNTVYVLKNIENEFYGTFHTFKNYFATVFSIFNF